MPLAPLARPSDVKLLFGDSVELPDDGDTRLSRLIEIASNMVREETGRRFSTRETGVTRKYKVSKEGIVYIDELLSEDDVDSVTSPLGSVIADYYEVSPEGYPTRGSYLHLAENHWPDYASLPPEHLNFFTTNLKGLPSGRSVWEYPGARLEVTGDFGYTQIPTTIRHLTARAVAMWWRSEIGTGGRGGEEGQVDPLLYIVEPDALPPVILATLRKSWKHPQRVA